MSKYLWIAFLGFLGFLGLLGMQSVARALEILLHPDEAKIVEQIIAVEGHSVEVAEVPGWAKRGLIRRLKELGIETANRKSWGMRDTKRNAVSLNCVFDDSGRVFALCGKGPWLPDESLRALQVMPVLRSIRFHCNGNVNHPRSSLNRGVGFDVLMHSRLIDVRLTLGMPHAGMEQAAKIKGLKSFGTLHSQVRDGGVKYFEGHPTLEAFTVSEMGNVSQAALASIAKMPKVEQVGFHEAFVTYDGGFEH